MEKEEKQTYYYTSRTGKREKVFCTRYEYLLFKLYCDINGLNPTEYAEFKSMTK